MNLLAIDSSTPRLSVALLHQDAITFEEVDVLQTHAKKVLPMIASLLKAANLSQRELDGIVFGQGPGSFTGLRIAASVAKGLAFAYDLPVYPVSTLLAIAEEFWANNSAFTESAVLAMIDARMNQVYWSSIFPGAHECLEQVTAISEVKISDQGSWVLAGVGYQGYFDQLPAFVKARLSLDQEVYPSAMAMLRIVRAGKIPPTTAAKALPVYVRNQVV